MSKTTDKTVISRRSRANVRANAEKLAQENADRLRHGKAPLSLVSMTPVERQRVLDVEAQVVLELEAAGIPFKRRIKRPRKNQKSSTKTGVNSPARAVLGNPKQGHPDRPKRGHPDEPKQEPKSEISPAVTDTTTLAMASIQAQKRTVEELRREAMQRYQEVSRFGHDDEFATSGGGEILALVTNHLLSAPKLSNGWSGTLGVKVSNQPGGS